MENDILSHNCNFVNMRLAIFLDNINHEDISLRVVKMLMFDVNDSVIMSIGEETLSLDNSNYIILMLLSNEVVAVYANHLPERLKKLLGKAEIEYHSLEELKDNPLFRSFLL